MSKHDNDRRKLHVLWAITAAGAFVLAGTLMRASTWPLGVLLLVAGAYATTEACKLQR